MNTHYTYYKISPYIIFPLTVLHPWWCLICSLTNEKTLFLMGLMVLITFFFFLNLIIVSRLNIILFSCYLDRKIYEETVSTKLKLKSGDPTNVLNYRLIPILSHITHIAYSNLLFTSVSRRVLIIYIIDDNQHSGFRPGK